MTSLFTLKEPFSFSTKRDRSPVDTDSQTSRDTLIAAHANGAPGDQPMAHLDEVDQTKSDNTYKARFGLVPGVKADGLDEIIMGVKKGTVNLPEQEDLEELVAAAGAKAPAPSHPQRPIAPRGGTGDSGDYLTDDEDPKTRETRGKALREVARRQAHQQFKERNPDGPYKAQQAHDGSRAAENPNEDIALALEELEGIYAKALHKNTFQKHSYTKTASLIRNIPYRIESYEQALEVKGIGKSMAERIREYLSHGRTLRAMYEDTPEARAVEAFGKIYGVGASVANRLVEKGAMTIKDLARDPEKYDLTPAQRFGIEWYDDLNQRIPRTEVEALFEKIKFIALEIDPGLRIQPMGSYRRGDSTSGDLDILMTRDPTLDGKTHSGVMRSLIARLVEDDIVCYTVAEPHDWDSLACKWMGAGRLSPTSVMRRIDILATPFQQWGAALIYFTGNNVFNRSIRLYANRQGYTLNDKGLFKGPTRDARGVKQSEGRLVASKTEEEIFEVLGIRWRPPHLRRP